MAEREVKKEQFQFNLLVSRNYDGTCDIHFVGVVREHLDMFFSPEMRDVIEIRLMEQEL